MAKASNVKYAEPLVSVVVPIYNVEQYLPCCLNSIVNQTYQNLQIILVNDGSTDSSPEIIEQYAKRDKRIEVVNKKNGGLSEARNYGISRSRGKYTALVDSDDYIDLKMVEALTNEAIERSADLVISGYTLDYPSRSIPCPATKISRIVSSRDALYSLLYSEGVDVSAWGKLYATRLIKKYHYPVGRIHEDSATTYKFIMAAESIYIDDHCMYHYRRDRNESITNKAFSGKELDLIKSTQEMTEEVGRRYPDLAKACTRKLMWAYQSVFRRYSLSNRQTRQKYIKTGRMLYDYIHQHRRETIADPNAPRRDRIACRLAMSYNLLILSNRLYERFR